MLDLMKYNYDKKLLNLFDQGKFPTVCLQLVDICHDDWCAIFRASIATWVSACTGRSPSYSPCREKACSAASARFESMPDRESC